METSTEATLEDAERAAKIEAQWPKPHACRSGPAFICKEIWDAWPLHHAGRDEYASFEMKHCPHCWSTLMALTEIHNEEAES